MACSMETFYNCEPRYTYGHTSEAMKCELGGVSLRLPLVKILALDFVASFMLHLASTERGCVLNCIGASESRINSQRGRRGYGVGGKEEALWRNSFCDSLAKILVMRKLCEDEQDALMTIIPAFIAHDIHLPEPLSKADEAANKMKTSKVIPEVPHSVMVSLEE